MDWAADYSSIAKEHKQRQNRTNQREVQVQAARAQSQFMSSPGDPEGMGDQDTRIQSSNKSIPEPGREGWSEGLYGTRHRNSRAVCSVNARAADLLMRRAVWPARN